LCFVPTVTRSCRCLCAFSLRRFGEQKRTLRHRLGSVRMPTLWNACVGGTLRDLNREGMTALRVWVGAGIVHAWS
jgi:hypothetical protein